MKAKLYHNPRCSKSRAVLGLLEARGIDFDVVEYLKSPPSEQELRSLLKKLGLEARDIVRSSEAEFQAAKLAADASDDELLALIAAHPKILQRPIVEVASRARIGRPPEQVLELFE